MRAIWYRSVDCRGETRALPLLLSRNTLIFFLSHGRFPALPKLDKWNTVKAIN